MNKHADVSHKIILDTQFFFPSISAFLFPLFFQFLPSIPFLLSISPSSFPSLFLSLLPSTKISGAFNIWQGSGGLKLNKRVSMPSRTSHPVRIVQVETGRMDPTQRTSCSIISQCIRHHNNPMRQVLISLPLYKLK